MFGKCFLCLFLLCHCHISLLPVRLSHKILSSLVYTTTGLPWRSGSLWKPPVGVRPHPQLDGEELPRQTSPGREGRWMVFAGLYPLLGWKKLWESAQGSELTWCNTLKGAVQIRSYSSLSAVPFVLTPLCCCWPGESVQSLQAFAFHFRGSG